MIPSCTFISCSTSFFDGRCLELGSSFDPSVKPWSSIALHPDQFRRGRDEFGLGLEYRDGCDNP